MCCAPPCHYTSSCPLAIPQATSNWPQWEQQNFYLFFNKLLNLLSFIYTFFFLQIFGWVYYHSFVNWSITKCICAVFFKHVPHASVCIICTCAHRLPQQKRSKMIKIVSCCSVAVSFGGHEQWKVSQRVPRSPFSSLLTNTITNSVTVSVTLPDTMGVDFHALLGARPRKEHAKLPGYVLYVQVWLCVSGRMFGCKTRQQFWEQRVRVMSILTCAPSNAYLDWHRPPPLSTFLCLGSPCLACLF